MQKPFVGVALFMFGVTLSIGFQNCGGSTLKANNSEGEGLRVEVVQDNSRDSLDGDDTTGDDGGDNNTGGGDTGGGDSGSFSFSFNLNNGDNIFYTQGGGFSPNLSTSRILAKIYYTLLESNIYEESGTNFQMDLTTGYCANSAFAHCEHKTSTPCVGLGCFKSTTPVRCHWQKRLSTAEINNTFQSLNSLSFLTRLVTAQDPMIADCNDPNLYFYKQGQSLQLSLAEKACVNDGQYYAINSTGAAIKAVFNNELSQIHGLTDNSGGAEFCNNYAAYAWDTTKFEYKAYSGYTTQENSFLFEASYEGQRVDLKYKESGSDTVFCATGVPVQPTELDALFPRQGLQYEMYRPGARLADASTAEIIYEDPVDGGAVRHFYMNRSSASTDTGGAVMKADQAEAIRVLIQEVLLNRAKVSNTAVECAR